MSRTTWNISVLGSGNVFVSDGTIYKPNENLTLSKSTKANTVQLANGDIAMVIPEVKYMNNVFTLTWIDIDNTDTLIDKIETYVENADYVKITTHLGEELIGIFSECSKIHYVGIDDTFDLTATFLQY